jgi:hypothetical protein
MSTETACLALLWVSLLGEDFSGQGIDIDATSSPDFEALMPIKHHPIWPGFQRAWLSWLQFWSTPSYSQIFISLSARRVPWAASRTICYSSVSKLS